MGVFKVPRISLTDRNTITPAEGEIFFETTNRLFYGGDNTTVGGFPIGLSTTPAVSATFADTTVSLGIIPSGYRIINVIVVVSTVFDDLTAQLSVGTALLPTVLVSMSDIDPFTVGQYSIPVDYTAAGATEIIMALTPNASTQGAFFAYMEVGT